PPPASLYTLSLHDALPISSLGSLEFGTPVCSLSGTLPAGTTGAAYSGSISEANCTASTYTASGLGSGACSGLSINASTGAVTGRSEEHTSELQSLAYLVCR